MSSPPSLSREPWLDRTLDYIGFATIAGTVTGAVYNFIKGYENSPAGHRLAGAVKSVRKNAPQCGAKSFAYSAIFSVSDYALTHLRQKEDHWNFIIATATTVGIQSLRLGPVLATAYAIGLGTLAAIGEVGLFMVERSDIGAEEPRTPPKEYQLHPRLVLEATDSGGSSSLFRSLFGARRVEGKKVSQGFNLPPSFKYQHNLWVSPK